MGLIDANYQRTYSRRLRFEPLESRRALSITVDTLVDENNGVGVGAGTSLREATAAAVSGDTIDFLVTGTINLAVGASNTTKQLTIDKNLTISGPGASLLKIRAFDPTPATKTGDGSRVFTIDDGSSTTLRDVSISGLTLTGGDTATSGGAISSAENLVVTGCTISSNSTSAGAFFDGGGGIFSQATFAKPNTLTIRNSALSGNTALLREGGAVRQRYGKIVIENSTISNNSGHDIGGGLSASGAIVEINSCTFSVNQAIGTSGAQGGAIAALNGTLAVTDSTIIGNASKIGGGVYAINSSAVSITRSVISTNTSTRAGGGIAVVYATLSVIDCTLSGNTGTGSASGGAISADNSPLTVKNSTLSGNSARNGGAIAADQGTAAGTPATLIENCTISGNTATDDLGAIYAVRPMLIRFCTITGNTTPASRRGAVGSFGGGSTITVYSSIISGNTNGDIGYNNSPSPFISLGYNLIGTGNNASLASFNQAGDQTGVLNPMLGPLADNGGATRTRMPLAGSPAIDAGSAAALAGMSGVPLYDQRGNPYTRVWDGDGVGGNRIDIGAVELQTQPLPAAVFGDYDGGGTVNAGDYILGRKMIGATVTPYSGADGSGNGIIGAEDYDVWRAHFGETYPTGNGASEMGVAGSATLMGAAVDGATTTPFAGAQGGPPFDVGVVRIGGSARILPPAKPGDDGRSRDDALVAWVESAGRVREGRVVDLATTDRDSVEKVAHDSCDVVDVAVGELVSAALL